MSKITIYHNPACSKSRETLALLKNKGIEPNVIEYLKNPPTKEEIKQLLTLLDISAHELIRKKESAYKEANLEEATGAQLTKAMADNPVLIERPIVIANGKAAIGRPPENILDIL